VNNVTMAPVVFIHGQLPDRPMGGQDHTVRLAWMATRGR
jgi:hypothetical protein